MEALKLFQVPGAAVWNPSGSAWLGCVPRSSTLSFQHFALCSKSNAVRPVRFSHRSVKFYPVCARMPNTHPQSCEHKCRWPRCGEVSMSMTKTEWNKLGFFGSVSAVNQLNHEQSVFGSRTQATSRCRANTLLFSFFFFCFLCRKLQLVFNVSYFCASFLTQVKCFTSTRAPLATAWWPCSWSPTCGSATPCWSPWNTTLRSSPSTSLSLPRTHYGETWAACLHALLTAGSNTWTGNCRRKKNTFFFLTLKFK